MNSKEQTMRNRTMLRDIVGVMRGFMSMLSLVATLGFPPQTPFHTRRRNYGRRRRVERRRRYNVRSQRNIIEYTPTAPKLVPLTPPAEAIPENLGEKSGEDEKIVSLKVFQRC